MYNMNLHFSFGHVLLYFGSLRETHWRFGFLRNLQTDLLSWQIDEQKTFYYVCRMIVQ